MLMLRTMSDHTVSRMLCWQWWWFWSFVWNPSSTFCFTSGRCVVCSYFLVSKWS